jgi:signal transduction histidine kinase
MRKGVAAPAEVHEAIQEVDRLDQTVARLLTFGRAEVRNRQVQDVNPLLERALRIVDDQARQKDVRIVLNAGVAGPLMAEVDALAIEQILINLLMNAIDASPGRGTVTVSASRTNDGLRIEVRDAGSGIQPETREHIFSPYFTTKTNGTGLGLAISREMASHHDGDIEFESTAEGTTFALQLPAHTMRL